MSANLVPRFCAIVWMETPVPRVFDPRRAGALEADTFDVVRSLDSLFAANSSLDGLFNSIRENEATFHPPAGAQESSQETA
jgi:hypothetical protein